MPRQPRRAGSAARPHQHDIGLVVPTGRRARASKPASVVAAVNSSAVSNSKSAMPTTRNGTGGIAEAAPEAATRSGNVEPGAEREPCGQSLTDDQWRRSGDRIRCLRSFAGHDPPGRGSAPSDTLRSVTHRRAAPGPARGRDHAERPPPLAPQAGARCRPRRAAASRIGTRSSTAVGCDNPDVVPGCVEQIAKRHEQSPREQQHVEQQRADDRDAGHRQKGRAAGSAATVRQARARDVIGAMSDTTSRRSSVHEAARPASDTERNGEGNRLPGDDAVTRTNMSVVS